MRMNKMNSVLRSNNGSKSSSNIWEKIAYNLHEKMSYQARKNLGWFWSSKLVRSGDSKKADVNVLITWTPEKEYSIDKEFFELVYTLQTHSNSIKIIILTENSLISAGAQKHGLLGRFSEYSLTSHDLEQGLAVNKGFRNVENRGLDSGLEKVLEKAEENSFEKTLDEKQATRPSESALKPEATKKPDDPEKIKKVSKLIAAKRVEHDVLLAVLVLSSDSSKNEWIATNEIFALSKPNKSEGKWKQKIPELIEGKILIEDKTRVKFYDEFVFKNVKKNFDE